MKKGKPIEPGCLVMVVANSQPKNLGRTGIAKALYKAGQKTPAGDLAPFDVWLVEGEFFLFTTGAKRKSLYFSPQLLIRIDDDCTESENTAAIKRPALEIAK
jgi:hypothetical protein